MQYFIEYYDMCTCMSYVPGSTYAPTFCGLDLATPPSDILVAVSTSGSQCC